MQWTDEQIKRETRTTRKSGMRADKGVGIKEQVSKDWDLDAYRLPFSGLLEDCRCTMKRKEKKENTDDL